MEIATGQLIQQVVNYHDFILIAALIIIFASYGFLRGAKAISELAIAIPVAAFVFMLVPYKFSWGEPIIFAVLVVASIWVLARDTSGLDDSKNLYKVVMSALGATGLLLVIAFSTVDFSSLYIFGEGVTNILTDNTYKFYITIVSLVMIALSRKV